MNTRVWWAAVVALMLLAAACGPYEPKAERTAPAADRRFVAYGACDAASGDGTVIPDVTRDAAGSTDSVSSASATAQAIADAPTSSATPCPNDGATPTAEATHTAAPTEPPVVTVVTVTPAPTMPPTATPTTAAPSPPRPETTAEPTSAAATATARASGSVAYLSIGDGIQWGCCGALGSSSPSLFRDYLETRLGRPVIWQTSGFGYQTTDTFINGMEGTEPQLDFALTLIGYYRNAEVPIAAMTISIGGNNLVDIGRACASQPCIEAFVAGLDHLREQLHVIYARLVAAKDPSTPLLALLYYDANECGTYAGSGAAVDAWNAVIAEVASQYGAFLVDARSLFRGHCDWIDTNGLDANAAGHAAIAAEYQQLYEALPPELRLPR